MDYYPIENPNLSQAKEQQQVYEKQIINKKALMVRALRLLYQTYMELEHYDRAISCLNELREMDYIPYLKATDLQFLAHC